MEMLRRGKFDFSLTSLLEGLFFNANIKDVDEYIIFASSLDAAKIINDALCSLKASWIALIEGCSTAWAFYTRIPYRPGFGAGGRYYLQGQVGGGLQAGVEVWLLG